MVTIIVEFEDKMVTTKFEQVTDVTEDVEFYPPPLFYSEEVKARSTPMKSYDLHLKPEANLDGVYFTRVEEDFKMTRDAVWKVIPGFDGLYEINKFGMVRKTRGNLQYMKVRNGMVKLTLKGKRVNRSVHKLRDSLFRKAGRNG